MRSTTLGVPGAIFALSLSACSETVFDASGTDLDIQDTWVDPTEPDRWSAVPCDGESATGREPFGCKLKSGIADEERTRLSYAAVAQLASSAGVRCGLNLVKAVALAAAESGRFQYAYLQNRNCAYDRGLWQINSKYWEDYSSYEATTNAEGMYVISEKGTDWTPWIAYTNGTYREFWSSACHAVTELCGKSYCQ